MANQLHRVSNHKWPGVYCYESESRKHQGKMDVCYYYTFKIDGVKKTQKVGWASEGYSPQIAAEERAKKVRKKRHGGKVRTDKEIRREHQRRNRTLGEIKKAYFESDRGENLKGRTTDLNRYKKHLEKLLGKRPIDSLSEFNIDRIKSKMKKSHKAATIANTLELLRRIINYGIKNNLCGPIGFTIELPVKDNQVTEYLTPEETKRFLKTLDEWPTKDVARMLKLAFFSAMRRGEIFKLQNEDIDFNQKIVTLRNPKGKRTVSIPMSEPVSVILKEQIQWRDEKHPKSPFVFPGRGGQQRVDCSAADRIKTEAQLPDKFRIFHGLRHHLAVTLANSGEYTLDMIGELLTHKSHAMTRRYAKFLPDAKKQAADRAAILLQENLSKIDSLGKEGTYGR